MIKIGSKIKVVNAKRSWNENGAIGTIIGKNSDGWLVDFGVKHGALMDYHSEEIEEIEEIKTK